MILAVIGWCAAAQGHVADEFITVPVLAGEPETAIVMDGALDDWAALLGPPLLTLSDLYGDPEEVDGTIDAPDTYAINVWLAVAAPDRIYMALEWRDDLFSPDRSGEWFDGQVEILLDGDHSGDLLSANAAQRCAVIPRHDGSVSIGYVGTDIDWWQDADYIDAVATLEVEPARPNGLGVRGVVELYVTAFDEVDSSGPGASTLSNLTRDDGIWGLSLIFADVDSPDRRFVAVFGRSVDGASGLRLRADEFAHVKTGPAPPTQIDFSTWGHLKHR